MKRALVVAIAFCSCALIPVEAQQNPRRVEGGTSHDDAPVIQPGRPLNDSLRAGETLFYALPVPEGQRGLAAFTIKSRAAHPPIAVRLRVYNVQKVEDPFAVRHAILTARSTIKIATTTQRVGAPNPDYPVPGPHYFSVSLASQPGSEPLSEFPVVLKATRQEVPRVAAAAPESESKPQTLRLEEEPDRTLTYLFAGLISFVLGALVTAFVLKLGQGPRSLRSRL